MNTQTQKITGREKFSYLLANIGNIPLMTLLSSYFLIYYTDVIGLDPAMVATLFLIAKVSDAVNDPIVGFLMDKFPVTRMGKFRPLLILGTIICSINYALLWFGAVWFPAIKYVMVYATYLLLGVTFAIMDISLNSLLPVMTTDNRERNSLSVIKALGYALGGVAISIIGPVIVASGTLQSYYILVFGSLAVVLVCSIVGALGVRENVAFDGSEEEKYGIRDLLKFLTCGPVAFTFLTSLLSYIGGQIQGSANTYFYTYMLGDLKLLSTVTVISLIGLIPGMILSPVLADRLGKKKVYGIGLLISAIGIGSRIFAPTSLTLLFVASIVGSVGSGLSGPLGYGIQADNTMYVQYTTGRRAEAAIASLSSFITKLGQGIGGAIPGYILALTGYAQGAAVQAQSVHTGIILCVIVLPALMSLVGTIVFTKGYTLDKQQIDEISEAISAGRHLGQEA